VQKEIGAVVDLLSHPGFLTGLGIGLLAAALLLATGVGGRRDPRGWGLAFASTVAVGVSIRFDVDLVVYISVIALVLVGLVGDLLVGGREGSAGPPMTMGYWLAALFASFGLVSLLQVGEVGWAPWVLPIVIAGSGAGIWLLSRSDVSEAVGPMVAISIAGMWVTVPETDMITVLVGAGIPFALATLPPLRARALVAGALAIAGMMAWVVFVEGVSRPWTIAASWATLATLPILGVLVWIRPGSHNKYLVFGIHVAYVVVITRVADITDSAATVAAAALLLGVSAGVAAFVVERLYEPVRVGS